MGKRVDAAKPGDNVGMNIKGLDKNNTLKGTKSFSCQIQTLDNIPGELKTGYSPIGFVRCGRAACRMTEITWKMGKETGGQKLESPPHLKANEVAQATFEP